MGEAVTTDQSTNRVRYGFTLIELLAVLGIIALLLAMLLPAIANARRDAWRVACLANQKQILAAIFMYANEHHNYLPGPADPSVNDPRIVNPQPGSPADPTSPNSSQMDVWNGIDAATGTFSTYYSDRELSNQAMVQQYLGGVSGWKVWQCPAAQQMWDQATPTTASAHFMGKPLGYGYMINNVGTTAATSPTFLFGSYSHNVSKLEKTPKKLSEVSCTIDPSNSVISKDGSKIWLLCDLDGRNFYGDSTGTSMSGVFGIVVGSDSDTIEMRNKRPWQPVHSVNSQMPTTPRQRSGIGRNFGFLDGHAEYLLYADWPASEGGMD